MAALLRFRFTRRGFQELLDLTARTAQKLKAPLAGPTGKQVEKVWRLGIDKQFQVGGIPSWVQAHPFGTEFTPAPITLGGTSGRIAKMWANAPAETGPREMRIRQTNPIALAHHRGALIKPRGAASVMRAGLGRVTGAWLSEERLQVGLRLPERAVNATQEMLDGTKAIVFLGFSPA